MIKEDILSAVKEAAIKAAIENKLGEVKEENVKNLSIEKTRNPEFGDYAVNVSPLAKFAKLPPVKIAEVIISYISLDDMEINPITGFINFKIGKKWLNKAIETIIQEKDNYGKNNFGDSEKVLLEYVSANPTGPLHIGHGRWAAVGSALANIMKFSGYEVDQEFYINDAGNQINNLGKSLWIRVLQELAIDAKFPETEEEGSKNYYAGDYLIPVAKDYVLKFEEKAKSLYKENTNPLNPSDEVVNEMSNFAKAIMLDLQKDLLNKFKVNFEYWYSESTLHAEGKVKSAIEDLKNRNELFEEDGAMWFRSSKYGDDQDRVIIKKDGSYTYLTADIAYHYEKIKRGYQKLINIWGADHHGYVARMKAAIDALGHNSECLEVLLGQLVNLIISGEQVRMGKRRRMLTLEELMEEVGIDATRYWMIMRSIDTTLDFDVDLAKSCSDENPVYYVQYAHARASSILRTAVQERLDQDTKETLSPYITKECFDKLLDEKSFNINIVNSLWNTSDEKELSSTKALILRLESFMDVVLGSAKYRAPYQIAKYIQDLAGDFHYFYTFSRVLNIDE